MYEVTGNIFSHRECIGNVKVKIQFIFFNNVAPKSVHTQWRLTIYQEYRKNKI